VSPTKLSLLKTLTHAELKEVASRHDLAVPSGLKRAAVW
jgi:hypothetical protein